MFYYKGAIHFFVDYAKEVFIPGYRLFLSIRKPPMRSEHAPVTNVGAERLLVRLLPIVGTIC